jgi:cysteinyl-tRNA synthetase
MPMRLFNTLSGKLEEFRPSEDNLVRMYSCGPTVYNFAHIGNFRTFVAIDILRRALRWEGFQLKHVMNLTDVDDRIIENSAKQHITVQQYTKQYEDAFFEDSAWLNLEKPEVVIRATEHIPAMVDLIAQLAAKGAAYKTDDGSYYYRVSKFPQYGKLSKKDLARIEDGARVDSDRFEKEEARDFALWKAPKPGEAFWESEIGPGRPGWHIECSAMAMEYLGPTFDLHAGGEDLMFPHHENEIAQSEAATGKPFALHWMHVRFLLIESDKMSKSLGNFHTLRDLMLMGHKPSSIRFLLSSVPYRKQLNFTWDGLKQAAQSVERLRNFKLRLEQASFPAGSTPAMVELATETVAKMKAGLEDDLNTAVAQAAIFDLVRAANTAADSGELKAGDVPALLDALKHFDAVFDVLRDDDLPKMKAALAWARQAGREVPVEVAKLLEGEAAMSDAEIEKLIADRAAAKKARDFKRSDAIRDQLAAAGIILEDTKDGVRWKRK